MCAERKSNGNEQVEIMEPEFYTPDELASLLRISKRTLEKWTFRRQLPVVKVGHLNRYSRVEIQRRFISGRLLK